MATGSPSPRTLSIFAPAKINFYLHVCERLPDNYHDLDSLIGFVDIGDNLTLSAAEGFEFEISGPFAGAFNAREQDSSPASSNIVVKAAWAMARATEKTLDVKVTLDKNLPLGGGVGGGSADAAALIWGLLQWWDLPKDAPYLLPLMRELGSDVPVCFRCKTVRVRGTGDAFDDVSSCQDMPIVLVHPGKPCLTPSVFAGFQGPFTLPTSLPEAFADETALLSFIEDKHNDLSAAAMRLVPEIENVLRAMEIQKGCALSRMSGAGSTCFGLFDDFEMAEKAAQKIAQDNPDWWVKAGWTGRPERY